MSSTVIGTAFILGSKENPIVVSDDDYDTDSTISVHPRDTDFGDESSEIDELFLLPSPDSPQ